MGKAYAGMNPCRVWQGFRVGSLVGERKVAVKKRAVATPWWRNGSGQREKHIPGSSLAYTLGCSCDSPASSQTNLLPSPSMDFPNCFLRIHALKEEIERGNRKGMGAHIQTVSTILNCLIGVSTSSTSNFCTSLSSLESWTAASGERSLLSWRHLVARVSTRWELIT